MRARRVQARRGELLREPVQVREAGREADHVHGVLRAGVRAHDLVLRQARVARDLAQVGAVLAAVADRHLDQPAG